MYALTLHQPWASAIAYSSKRLENRGWVPPKRVIGQRLAIHAGLQVNTKDYAYLLERGYDPGPKHQLPKGAVLAVATVTGYVTAPCEDPWFMGTYGWVLDDVVTLEDPIPCRGAQGLWHLPEDVLAALTASLQHHLPPR